MRTRIHFTAVTWLALSLLLATGCTQASGAASPPAQPAPASTVASGATSPPVQPASASTAPPVVAPPAPTLAALQPAPPSRIIRNEVLEEVVEFEGKQWRMVIVELVFGPGAETAVHTHPGPSSGYMQNGRIAVNVVGERSTSTFAAGSAIHHPWDRPHVFRNPSDETVRMLSFELIPL